MAALMADWWENHWVACLAAAMGYHLVEPKAEWTVSSMAAS